MPSLCSHIAQDRKSKCLFKNLGFNIYSLCNLRFDIFHSIVLFSSSKMGHLTANSKMVSKVCDPEKKNFFTTPHLYGQLGSPKYACQYPSGSPVPCNHAKEILC